MATHPSPSLTPEILAQTWTSYEGVPTSVDPSICDY
jgi:hypothetical protein